MSRQTSSRSSTDAFSQLSWSGRRRARARSLGAGGLGAEVHRIRSLHHAAHRETRVCHLVPRTKTFTRTRGAPGRRRQHHRGRDTGSDRYGNSHRAPRQRGADSAWSTSARAGRPPRRRRPLSRPAGGPALIRRRHPLGLCRFRLDVNRGQARTASGGELLPEVLEWDEATRGRPE